MSVGPEHQQPNFYVDSDHPAVVAFTKSVTEGIVGPTAQAVALFYAVRDGFRYNPWRVRTEKEAYKASNVLMRAREEGGHCIDKATLLAACARAAGIPSRLHFADVRNHIGTAKLEEALGTDLLVFHGYAELHLGDRFVAATPAFNRELCERLGVAPLEWDGQHDAVFQAFDRADGTPERRFMEVVTDRGTTTDIPYDRMIAAWKAHYKPFRSGGWPRGPA